MKTTLDLPDDLLIAAKTVAASRRTTLRALIEHSLRREIQPALLPQEAEDFLEAGPLGILRLKKRGAVVTPEKVGQLMAEADTEELRDALASRKGKEA